MFIDFYKTQKLDDFAEPAGSYGRCAFENLSSNVSS